MAQTKHALHDTKMDLPEQKRAALVKLLNNRLCDIIDLQLQAKQAHWTVKGPHFIGLHKLFDEISEAAFEWTDLIAERAVILGGQVEGTVQAVAERTSLPTYSTEIFTCEDHVEAFSSALAGAGEHIRKGIEEAEKHGDADTADMFTEISRAIDKFRWFVEAHQQADR